MRALIVIERNSEGDPVAITSQVTDINVGKESDLAMIAQKIKTAMGGNPDNGNVNVTIVALMLP